MSIDKWSWNAERGKSFFYALKVIILLTSKYFEGNFIGFVFIFLASTVGVVIGWIAGKQVCGGDA